MLTSDDRSRSSLLGMERFDFVAKLDYFPAKVRAVQDLDLGKALSVVYLDVNSNICNHACTFCDGFYRPLATKSIPTSRLLTLADEMADAGVQAVVIAGDRGEPLLHPGLARLLEKLAAHGIEIGIYTNASIISDELLDALRSIAWLRISADSATAATHRLMHVYPETRDDFPQMLSNLVRISETVADIGMSFILDTGNVHEIGQAADLYLGLGARFVEYKPKYLPDYTPDADWLVANGSTIRDSIVSAQQRWGDRVVLNNQVSDLLDAGRLPTLQREPRQCLTSLLRMVISTHGCYSCTPYRGEAVRRFGDILTQSLSEILQAAERVRLLDMPCSRICAYDKQNDHLLALRQGGTPASVQPHRDAPRPQDKFI